MEVIISSWVSTPSLHSSFLALDEEPNSKMTLLLLRQRNALLLEANAAAEIKTIQWLMCLGRKKSCLLLTTTTASKELLRLIWDNVHTAVYLEVLSVITYLVITVEVWMQRFNIDYMTSNLWYITQVNSTSLYWNHYYGILYRTLVGYL